MTIVTRLCRYPGRTVAVALICALVIGGVVWITSFNAESIPDQTFNAESIPDQTRDPAKLAAARSLIAGLPAPDDSTLDAFGTACRAPAPFCATSETQSARSLMKDVEDALRARGAQVQADECIKHEDLGLLPAEDLDLLPDLANCAATVTFDGALINVAAGDRRNGPAASPAYVFAVVQTDGLTTQANKPLPAFKSLEITPPEWQMTAPCLTPVTAGCTRYSRTSSLAGLVDSLNGQLLAQLRASGYAVDIVRCRVAATGRRECLLAARRFRTVGGLDYVTVLAMLRQVDATTVSIRLDVQS